MKLPPFYTIVWLDPKPNTYFSEPFLGYLIKVKNYKGKKYLDKARFKSINNPSLGIDIKEISDWRYLTDEEKEKGESH